MNSGIGFVSFQGFLSLKCHLCLFVVCLLVFPFLNIAPMLQCGSLILFGIHFVAIVANTHNEIGKEQ